MDVLGARPGVMMKHRFPALFRNVIKQQASCDRTERGHRRVVRHSCREADREIDHQQIVDHRKRQNRRIEKCDQENAQAARGGDNRLQPQWQMELRLYQTGSARVRVAQPLMVVRFLRSYLTGTSMFAAQKPHSQEWLCCIVVSRSRQAYDSQAKKPYRNFRQLNRISNLSSSFPAR
jgi:hypothetical protein